MGSVYKIDGIGTRGNPSAASPFELANFSTDQRFTRKFASGAIAKGDAVAIDFATSTNGLGNHILKADIGTANVSCACGIALEAAASGDLIRIQVQGVCEEVALDDTNDSVGQPLAAGATAGQLTLNVATSTPVAIMVVEGSAGAKDSTVYLLNPLNL